MRHDWSSDDWSFVGEIISSAAFAGMLWTNVPERERERMRYITLFFGFEKYLSSVSETEKSRIAVIQKEE